MRHGVALSLLLLANATFGFLLLSLTGTDQAFLYVAALGPFLLAASDSITRWSCRRVHRANAVV